jgi:hypothetical protein
MTAIDPERARAVRLLVSDVDGTLVTADKRLTPATIEAVRRLGEAGIGFSLVSSRPAFGMRAVVNALGLTLPFGAFNGGAIVGPRFETLSAHLLPTTAAEEAVRSLEGAGIPAWVFTGETWLVTDPRAELIPRERRTIGTEPTLVVAFGDALAQAGKIVGATNDLDRLDAVETALRSAIGGTATVARSQPYYLDVTPAGVDKGTFLLDLAARLHVRATAVAAIGDMDNDVAMLRAAGLPIAMGNGSPAAKAAAAYVTATNEADGFAGAVDALLSARA